MRRLITPDEWRPRGVQSLELAADQVVRSTQNTLVTAGPGAGKTELLAQRASFLLETGACAYPKRILAISFKRDAAKNLQDRVESRSGGNLSRRFSSHTVDAFAKGILDQFRAALPDDLRPCPDYDVLSYLPQPKVEEILLSMDPPLDLGNVDDLREFASQEFFAKDVSRVNLQESPGSLKGWAALEFWRILLKANSPSQLSFGMINRLAGYLLQTDPRLLRAYRATYSHVFLDEFQDTTALQYWLMKLAFMNTNAIMTAVGDPRQSIMRWAGALPDIFSKFTDDFKAVETELHRNFRASEEIAPVIRYLAGQLGSPPKDSNNEAGEIRPSPSPEACAAHIFAAEDDEAEWIASEIDELISAGVAPRDIGVLVRMRSSDYCARVIEALSELGRVARVEDQLQNLFSEPIVEACMLALRALASEVPGDSWAEFRNLIADCRGIVANDERRRGALEQELSAVRQSLSGAHPNPPADAVVLEEILSRFIEPLVDPIRRRNKRYLRGSYFSENLQQLAAALSSAATEQSSWTGALDMMEGQHAVPILTIHKSKGLEYHAVFFVGLEDGAFWNFSKNPDEETSAFFVALSRAKKRVVFTFSRLRKRGGRWRRQTLSDIGRLYELMETAGVHMVRHDGT